MEVLPQNAQHAFLRGGDDWSVYKGNDFGQEAYSFISDDLSGDVTGIYKYKKKGRNHV